MARLTFFQRFLIALSAFLLGACGSVPVLTSMTDSALQMVGIQKPEVPAIPEIPDFQKPPRTIDIQLHAGARLNVDANGEPLALVTKIYKLKQAAAFQKASYETFLDPVKEKAALGADLLEVKEVTLVPGQRFEEEEKVSQEAYFLGVVSLFNTPSASRWRLTFSTEDAEKTGITVGVHACAMSVSSGKLVGDFGLGEKSLTSVKCTYQ